MASSKKPTAEVIDRVIRRNVARLTQPGVLTVRPGYEIASHQLTGKSAIVVTVHTKKAPSDLSRAETLPNHIDNIPVDVREATPYQRLRSHDPAAAALAQTHARPQDSQPAWPFERTLPDAKLLPDALSTTQQAEMAASSAVSSAATPAAATEHALTAHATKLQEQYVPANVPLVPVTTTTTITAHVSPDAGLATLQAFLGETKKSLVIGMYDFTSGPILKTFQQVLTGSKTLQMVLDDPPVNGTANQTDQQTIQALDTSLGTRVKTEWALDRANPLVQTWMFPYAYHIKVIVRDGTAFWLSSGNLNNSNQPDLTSPPGTEDRDWHVIIEDKGLAQLFGAYLDQDFSSAKKYQTPATPADAAAVAFAQTKLAQEQNPPDPKPLVAKTTKKTLVAKKVFKNVKVTITPLLTPDKLPDDPNTGQYLSNMTKLITSAKKSLYVQLQYIESSSGTGDYYDELLKTVAARVTAGVDVKLIVSEQYGESWAEKMKTVGVDLTANLALQRDVHNKGFVIDSKTVVVSSQNFSPAGVYTNRDAGVIIEHSGIAQYFEKVFTADWQNKAKPFAPPSTAKKKAAKKAAKKK